MSKMDLPQQTENMLTVGIVDSFPINRIGMEVAFRGKYPHAQVYQGNNLSELIGHLAGRGPDVLVMGVNDHQAKTLDAVLVPLRLRFETVPTVICFDTVNEVMVLKCLRAGVLGYVLKENGVDEFFACIDSVLAKRRYMSAPLERILFDLMIDQSKITRTDKTKTLTGREFTVAGFLSKGMKPVAIARELEIRASTVSTVKKNIFKKLNVNSVMELTRLIDTGRS